MRYLGIDYGLKRVGAAICDAGETIVSPLCQFNHPGKREALTARLLQIIEEHEVEAVVVGMPYNMDGTEGEQARLTRQFVKQMEEDLARPVYVQDERLSSATADAWLRQGELSQNKKRARRDMLAACAILQSFLDHKHGQATQWTTVKGAEDTNKGSD